MTYGSLAEWLTLAVVYLWAGVWWVDKINEHVGWDLKKLDEQLGFLFAIFFWLPVCLVAPFWKGPKE